MKSSLRVRAIVAILCATIIWAFFTLRKKPALIIEARDAQQFANIVPVAQLPSATGFLDISAFQNLEWGRNPFRIPSRKEVATARFTSPVWSLSGILYGAGTNPVAIINRRPVRIGDRIDGANVLKIDKTKVTLEYNGTAMTLTVNKG